MPLLFHWVGENYRADRAEGFEYNLNQNSPAMLKGKPGDTMWAFTRREDGRYVLAARGTIERVEQNKPGHPYGRYCAWLEPASTTYFDVDRGADVEPVIRALSIQVAAPILGQSFQGPAGVRLLSDADNQRLAEFTGALPTLPKPRGSRR